MGKMIFPNEIFLTQTVRPVWNAAPLSLSRTITRSYFHVMVHFLNWLLEQHTIIQVYSTVLATDHMIWCHLTSVSLFSLNQIGEINGCPCWWSFYTLFPELIRTPFGKWWCQCSSNKEMAHTMWLVRKCFVHVLQWNQWCMSTGPPDFLLDICMLYSSVTSVLLHSGRVSMATHSASESLANTTCWEFTQLCIDTWLHAKHLHTAS